MIDVQEKLGLLEPPRMVAADEAWRQSEAFLRVMLLVAVFNREKATVRLAAVEEFKRRSPFLRPIGEQGRIQLHKAAVEHMSACPDPLAEACAIIPTAVAPSVFGHALDLLIDDQPLGAADEELIESLRQHLHINVARALRMRDVIAIKNRW